MNVWVKAGALLLALGIAYAAGYSRTDKLWLAKWAARDATDARQTAQMENRERTEEQRRQDIANKEVEDAEKQLSAARHDAAVAQSAADRLQSELNRLTRQLADSETGKLSATAAARGEAAILLANMFSESVERNQQLANQADSAFTAGQTCERVYNGMTNQ